MELMLGTWLEILTLALVASTVSMMLAKARICQRVRATAGRWSLWLGELFHCPYCLSHWIALALVLIYRPRVTRGPVGLVDELVSLLVIVALATWWSKQICAALVAMGRLAVHGEERPSHERRTACP